MIFSPIPHTKPVFLKPGLPEIIEIMMEKEV